MEIISRNVANVHTTDNGGGQPYRRLEAVFSTDEDGMTGVSIEEESPDMSAFKKELDPGNPQADEQGYVSMPNVSLPIEMMNLTVASRAYQANAAILKRYQKMVETSLELLR
jgi:flagellar basal-body rod protein FlgC